MRKGVGWANPPLAALLAAVGLFSLIESFDPSRVNFSHSSLDLDFGLAFGHFVVVLPVSNLADYQNLVSLAHGQTASLFAPNHDAVPFGAGFPFIRIRFLPRGGRGNGEHCVAGAFISRLQFGVGPEESNQACFICVDHVLSPFLFSPSNCIPPAEGEKARRTPLGAWGGAD